MAVVVVRGNAAGFAQEVVVDQRHRLAADEPEAAGGTDTGPSPYDYLLVALGA
jgi:putative redox protein